MDRKNERIFYVASGLLLILGGLVFLWGGRTHPPTDVRLGPLGSETYFRNFVDHVLAHPAWGPSHAGILAGPVLWALGAGGLTATLRRSGESLYSSFAVVALALGAAAWTVAFVFDGFVAPVYARAFVESADPVVREMAMVGFQANQTTVIRLGLVSWILIGAATAGYAGSVLAAGTLRRPLRFLVGASGILLGLWPMVAWITGQFQPGPFTSALWIPTAVLTAVWYVMIGVVVATSRRLAGSPSPASGNPPP